MNAVYNVIDFLLPFEWTEFQFMKNALLAVLLITPLFGLVASHITAALLPVWLLALLGLMVWMHERLNRRALPQAA